MIHFKMASILSALVTLCLMKKDYFISSYPGKIIFGEIFDDQFIFERHFIFYRCDYCSFFEAFVKIMKSTRQKDTNAKGVILKNDDYTYFWQTFNGADGISVKFGIEKNEVDIVYSTIINYQELNNFLDCFKQLITSTLLLRQNEIELFETVSNLDVKTITDLQKQNLPEIYVSFKALKLPPKYENCILVQMNLDLILLLHKLNNIIDIGYRKDFKI